MARLVGVLFKRREVEAVLSRLGVPHLLDFRIYRSCENLLLTVRCRVSLPIGHITTRLLVVQEMTSIGLTYCSKLEDELQADCSYVWVEPVEWMGGSCGATLTMAFLRQ